MSGFAVQYLCTFTLTTEQEQLRRMAERYLHEAEAYDRTVCSGPTGRDGVRPANPRELALINRHAYTLLDRLAAELPTYSRQDLLREIASVERQGLHT